MIKKREISLKEEFKGELELPKAINIEEEIIEIIESPETSKYKTQHLEELYDQNIIPAYITIQYGVIEFLIEETTYYPTLAFDVLAELVEPDLEIYFDMYSHVFLQYKIDVVLQFNQQVYAKFCYFLCKVLLTFPNLKDYLVIAHYIITNLNVNIAKFSPSDEEYTAELFRYVTRSFFFSDYFTVVEIADYLTDCVELQIFKKFDYMSVYAECICNCYDMFHQLMEMENTFGLLSSLPAQEQAILMKFFLVAVNYTEYYDCRYVCKCISSYKESKTLAERAILVFSKLASTSSDCLLNISIDKLEYVCGCLRSAKCNSAFRAIVSAMVCAQIIEEPQGERLIDQMQQ